MNPSDLRTQRTSVVGVCQLKMLELNKIYNMDCLEGLKLIEDNSIDLIVTDPPYQLGFMGKKWDVLPSVEILKECLRVIKSGAFAFWLMTPRQDSQLEFLLRLRQVGFIISFTSLYWVYHSGFPKSQNISKAVDKKLGFEREKIPPTGGLAGGSGNTVGVFTGSCVSDKPISKEAIMLNGSYAGFQPKPAVEVIIVSMKPLSEKTYLAQALKNYKGITWLDECRIPFANEEDEKEAFLIGNAFKGKLSNLCIYQINYVRSVYDSTKGRFPANLIVSDDAINEKFSSPTFCEDFGSNSRYYDLDRWWEEKIKKLPKEIKNIFPILNVAKPTFSEKNKGCEKLPKKQNIDDGECANKSGSIDSPLHNFHPTCKPIELMSYIIMLGSKENDIVLDPFIGSGTTAISARLWNRQFIGFEKEKDYFEIALERIKNVKQQKKLNEIFQ
jgi:DNA modification methylase